MQVVSNNRTLDRNIHAVLAHSYFFFFFAFIFGLILDSLFPLRVFKSVGQMPLGGILIIFGTVLVLWAQHTSRHLEKGNITKETFCHGPYCFTRSPTHWGLFLLMLGFGIIANAFFVIIFTIFSLFITKAVFLRKEEEILVEKYGRPYQEYQKSVHF